MPTSPGTAIYLPASPETVFFIVEDLGCTASNALRGRRYLAEILPIWRKTLSNQSMHLDH